MDGQVSLVEHNDRDIDIDQMLVREAVDLGSIAGMLHIVGRLIDMMDNLNRSVSEALSVSQRILDRLDDLATQQAELEDRLEQRRHR